MRVLVLRPESDFLPVAWSQVPEVLCGRNLTTADVDIANCRGTHRFRKTMLIGRLHITSWLLVPTAY